MAATGSGIVAPDSFPIRQPTDKKQSQGRIVNPVRYYEIGGLDGPGDWGRDTGRPHGNPQTNVATVERATATKGAHSVNEK